LAWADLSEADVSTDAKGTKILARTFFNQLRSSGYNANQIIGIATELIDLVTEDLKGAAVQAEVADGTRPHGELRPRAP
jgi:hypothetical protein